MALTKVTGQVIKNTTDVTVGVLTVTNTLAVGGTVSNGGTLTYEDVTNVDAVGLITARNGIVVGSGITLSKDGDGFFTGVVTATSYILANGEEVGAASTENIRTNTNATFLQNINVGVAITAGKLGIGFTDTNVKVGNTALDSLTTGTNNTAVGTNALTANTGGTYNTAVGSNALLSNTTAAYNTVMGYGAADAVTTGSQNTVVGYNAFTSATTAQYSTATVSYTHLTLPTIYSV